MANKKQEMAWEETSFEYVNKQGDLTQGKKNEVFLNSSQKIHQNSQSGKWKYSIVIHKEIYSIALETENFAEE